MSPLVRVTLVRRAIAAISTGRSAATLGRISSVVELAVEIRRPAPTSHAYRYYDKERSREVPAVDLEQLRRV